MSDSLTTNDSLLTEPGSFRDRSSRVFYRGDAVYRAVNAEVYESWKLLASKRFYQQAVERGSIVATEAVPDGDPVIDDDGQHWAATLRHQTIPFISYPYEWCFSMLKDGALLQLELLESALAEEMTLKDASSFNIQWLGANPVFIDIGSFERYVTGTPWTAYRQFCEMFLYPLMLQAYRNVAFQPLLRGRIDGIPAEECSHFFSFRDILRAGVFLDVRLQSKLQNKYAKSEQHIKDDLRKSGFRKEMVIANLHRLNKVIRKLRWKQETSEWSQYAGQNSYDQENRLQKENFVRAVTSARKRRAVWDLGCNTGTFSRIASENSGYVVALDYDQLAVERLYRELRSENNRSILPLTMNLADPSPALGWRGLERKTLTERGTPDLALCLALIHHLVITANIPLREFVGWLASLKCDIVIEFVSKDDPMTKLLLKNKEDQYSDYETGSLEKYLNDHFCIAQRLPLQQGTRILYFAQRR